jgi:hypothetical protein
MPTRLIELPLGLPEQDSWTSWDCALALATIVPRLLSPDRARRRGRIRTLFYSELCQRTKGVHEPRAQTVHRFLDAYCNRRQHRLLETSRLSSYKRRLYLNSTGGAYIRPILTVGITAKVMASSHGVAKGRRVLATAQKYICDNYDTGIAVYANDLETRQAWFTWKHVAHICAALVDFLPLQSSPIINNTTLTRLECSMESFIATAFHYQTFLTGSQIIEGAEIPARSRQSFHLALLPDIKLVAAHFAKSELPVWDRTRLR